MPSPMRNRFKIPLGTTDIIVTNELKVLEVPVVLTRTQILPNLHNLSRLPRHAMGDVAKWLRRWIANPLFVGSNPTVASFFSSRAFWLEMRWSGSSFAGFELPYRFALSHHRTAANG